MDQGPGMPPRRDERTGLLIGGVLIALGAWLFLRQIVRLSPLWYWWIQARRFGWPLLIVLIGVLLIAFGSRAGAPHMPPRGTRLYKSRRDRWLSGVLGGIARYFGMDPVALRLAYIVIALVFGPPQAIVAYIAAAIIMPEEPAGYVEPGPYAGPGPYAPPRAQSPEPPSAPEAPSAPKPPSAPEPPASPTE